MRRLAIGGLACVGLLAACGSTSSSGTGSSAAGGSTSSGAGAGSATTVSVGNSAKLGPVLTDAAGHTLYYFLPEKGGTIACTGGCATTWPPATVSGTPIAGAGVSGTLGVVSLSDGSSEVTYQKWPLHTYSGDMAPGDTNGQGIAGKWYAATPDLTADSTGPGGGAPASGTSTSTYSSSSPYGY
jgi:predicted lipoprotein with Yx(FWY)xxD motif